MADQSPTECKNTEDARWMFNDRAQTPCQVLNASLHELDSKFSLSWLELSFQCGQSSTSTPSNTLSSIPSNTAATLNGSSPTSTTENENLVHDFCCSNVAYALYAACWSCQWDQPVSGYVRTTWADFWSSGNCTSSTSTSSSSTLPLSSIPTVPASISLGPGTSIASSSGHRWRRAPSNTTTSGASNAPRNAPLTKPVQRALDNAGIHIPSWAYLRASGDGLWDESVALASVSNSTSGQSKPNKLSGGAIAGTVIGVLLFISFLVLCIFRIRNRRKRQTRLHHWDTHRRTINSSKHGHDNGTKQDLGLLGWGWTEWKECLWPFSATGSGSGTPQHNMTAISNRGVSNNALGGAVMQIGRLSPASDVEKRGSQGPTSSKRVKSLFGRRRVDTISPVPALPSSTGARVDLDGDEGRMGIAPPPLPGLPTTGAGMGVSRMHSPEDYAKYNGPERVGSDLGALEIQTLHHTHPTHPNHPGNSAHGHAYQRTTPTPTGAGATGVSGRKSLVDRFRGSLARVGDLGMGLSSRGRQSPRSSPAPAAVPAHGHGTHHNMYGEGVNRSASVRSTERYTHPMGSNKTPNPHSATGMIERNPSPMGVVASRNPYANLANNSNTAPLTVVNAATNALLPPTGSSNIDPSPTPSPIPLTKEALAIARVAQDGSLFVPLSAAHSQQQHQLTIQPSSAMDTRAFGANDEVGIRLGESAMTRPIIHQHSTSDNSVLTGRFGGGAGVPAWHADMTPLRSDSLRRLGVATSHEAPPTFTGTNPFPLSNISSGGVGENSLYGSHMGAFVERPKFGEERVRTLSEGALARLNSATATSSARAGPSVIGGSGSRQATHPLSGGQFPSRAVLAPIGRPNQSQALAGVDTKGKGKAAKSEGSNGTSVKAAAGSAFGSSAREEGEEEDDDDDDDDDEEDEGGDGSGIQSIVSPAAATAGSSSSGSKPNGGAADNRGRNAGSSSRVRESSRGKTRGKRKTKKREVHLRHLSTTTGTSGASGGTDDRNARLSVLANTSLSSGQAGIDRSIAGYGGGVKSDGSRTPSPKVAPSAEWFNLFRGGSMPEGATGSSSKRDGGNGDLARNRTAPVASTSASAARPLGKASTNAGASASGKGKWKVTNVDAFQPFASSSTIGDTGVDVPATVPLIAKPQPRRVSPNSSKQELQQASTSKQPVDSTSKQTQSSTTQPTATNSTPIAALYATTMSGSTSSLNNLRNATTTTSGTTRTIRPQPAQPAASRVARPPSPATSTVLPYLQTQSTGSSHALVDKPLPPVQPSQPSSRPMPAPSTNAAAPALVVPPLSMNPFPTATRANPSTNALPASNVSVPSPAGPRALPSPTSPSGTRPIRMLPVPPSNSPTPPF